MYKNSIKTLVLSGVLVAFGASSCSESFLEKEPSEYVTPEQLRVSSQWNTSILLGQAAGATAISFRNGHTASNAHDDFGQKSYDIVQDIMSGDMEAVNISYGWYRRAAQLLGHVSSNADYSYRPWRTYYKIIYSANETIRLVATDEYSDLPTTLSVSQKYYWGMSKALRAYAYFELAQLYAKSYETDRETKVLPIYREASATAVEKSTLAEVYSLIVKDLQEGRRAIQESGIIRSTKSDINADVATAYLAYAYLQMGDYANAYREAKSVIDGGSFRLLNASELTTDGFGSVDNPEFMWAIEITKENTNSLVSFFPHIDVYTFGYASLGDRKVINADLQNSIPNTDLRGQWFGDEGNTSGLPLRKFFSQSNTAKTISGDREWLNDIHFMRLADMYLVAMEAAARQGNDSEAKTLLKALMAQRVESGNIATVQSEIDALSSADLLERIYYNWRVEMWGEGRSLMTMKRFKKTVARTSRSAYLAGQSIAYDDSRLTLQVPQSEVSNNPYF